MKRKVAFVVQRCGVEVGGGAENLCLQIAQHLVEYWDIEILTTCALDYMTWENHYPVGIEEVSGVKVRRFRISQKRNVKAFNRLSEKLAPRLQTASLEEQESWMKAQGPMSQDLIQYISQHREDYDTFIFFGYLYATTYFILPLVADKAYLEPLAHDEWTIYMTMWDEFFQKPRGFIFNTPEEKSFVQKRFPQLKIDGPVIGIGVDPPESYSAERFREQYNIQDPFLLYIGRIDPSKGCEELFQYFIHLRNQESEPRKLVLLGKSVMTIPEHPDIIPLGFVEEQTKWDALAACDLLVMPSPYESLSIVLLEAWTMGKAVLVNGKSDVLVGQCRRGNGGLWYENLDEFEYILKLLKQNTKIQAALSNQGHSFVLKQYNWETITEQYRAVDFSR
ncbi:glycosyltransferase family 4 protein [Spirulina subsalsa FACHB-351]|uniref:Glycosyltransferase family 4 protein n=1 Tax=Spirulina subsalsa FACHB-351 TaxID=234711 RepID=A0ABT3L720_9CYAN|nr:glycosyltransferase family 4 protein [Spirulina subsalsa]MCW6037303.1 glycosyltransferase family 4 protein [Spirulina subsalsa FACHB-351]